jgi:hypothetical protein
VSERYVDAAGAPAAPERELLAANAALARSLRLCAFKLKVEYDLQQPDAPANECWAEAEGAWRLLDELDRLEGLAR